MTFVDFVTNHLLASGVVALSIAIVLFTLVSRECVVRPDAWWSGERLTYIVFAPFITILSAAGGALAVAGIQHLSVQPVSSQNVAIAGSAMLIAAAITLALPRKGDFDHANSDTQNALGSG